MEPDFERWQEIRARVDSIATAIFLIGGGALSISIATLLGADTIAEVPVGTKSCVVVSWWLLAYSVVAFLLVKGLLVIQACKMLDPSAARVKWHSITTYANWCLGLTGMLAFASGTLGLVGAACSILIQHT